MRTDAGASACELACHPATPASTVRGISVHVARPSPATIRFAYTLVGDVAQLRVPPFVGRSGGVDLWRHTCFEAFVRTEGARAYHELNFAPSGASAMLAFCDYRAPAAQADAPALHTDAASQLDAASRTDMTPPARITVRSTAVRVELDAVVALAPAYAAATLQLALSAVVEDATGACSYWALHHPPGAPDFHHPDAFVLRVEPPAASC